MGLRLHSNRSPIAMCVSNLLINILIQLLNIVINNKHNKTIQNKNITFVKISNTHAPNKLKEDAVSSLPELKL